MYTSEFSMRAAAAAGLVLSVLLVTACGGATESDGSAASESVSTSSTESQPTESPTPVDEMTPDLSSASPSPSATGFADVVVGGELTSKEICSAYKKSLVSFQKTAEKRVKGSQGKVKDSYDAARFRKYNKWVKVDHSMKLEESLAALATDSLNEVSNGRAGSVNDLPAYLDASIEACGLSDLRGKAEDSVSRATTTGESIVAKANAKPWYPKGYNEWYGDENIAIKYTLAGGSPCGYSACRYGKAYIVSEYGCPSGVYAAANFSDSGGTVYDWDNDTLPALGAGKRGLLEFVSYGNRGSGSYQVVEISCR